MKHSHGSPGHQQVNWDAVGYGDGEENARPGGNPSIDAFDLDPSGAPIQGHHLHAVHLLAECHGGEFRQRPAKVTPMVHHQADGRFTPKAEIEPAARLGAAAGDAGDDSVLFPPIRDLESGNVACNGGFADWE